MKTRLIVAFLATVVIPSVGLAQQTEGAIIRYGDLQHPTFGPAGMVASQNQLSSDVGAAVLEEGGIEKLEGATA